MTATRSREDAHATHRELTEHGLVDEYQLIVNPVLLGSGRPLLSGVSKSTKVSLLEARTYPSGNVKLRYGRPG